MKYMLLIFAVLMITSACYRKEPAGITSCGGEPKNQFAFARYGDYSSRELRLPEKHDLINLIKSVDEYKYVLGAQDKEHGFDCSGLIVWAYSQLGFLGFRNANDVVSDLTADSLFNYNVTYPVPVDDPHRLIYYSEGDLLFFDANYDGRVEHVAVFSRYDVENDRVWVWDASDLTGKVSYRYITNFLSKHPYIGRPLLIEAN